MNKKWLLLLIVPGTLPIAAGYFIYTLIKKKKESDVKKWMPVTMRRRVKKILRKSISKKDMVELTDTELLKQYDAAKKTINNESLKKLIEKVDSEILEQYLLTDNAEE